MAEIDKILTIGGLDPFGYAGVVADASALVAVGVQPQVVITAQTDQTKTNALGSGAGLNASDYTLLSQQLDAIFAQESVQAVKIGQVPNAEVAEIIAAKLPAGIPVVWDTVLSSTSGVQLSSLDAEHCGVLLKKATLVTPNRSEALRLSGQETLPAAVDWFLQQGCEAVLITGADSAGEALQIEHYLHTKRSVNCITTARLPGVYRGSGCRFSSLIAVALARGFALLPAVQWAQDKMNRMLLVAKPVANGVFVPQSLENVEG